MHVIDLHGSFGRTPHGGRPQPLSALLAEAGRYGIAAVTAASQRGVYYDHVAGNDETIAAAREHPGLLPVGIVNPKQVDGDDEVERCLARGLRLFRFYPELQDWEVESLAFRRIVRRLGDAGAVVSVVAGGWGSIGRLAVATADLGAPVVALGVHYFQVGDCVEAMRQFPHLYAETHRLGTHGALAHLAKRVDVKRVVFGSGTPAKPLASALNNVWLADLADDERTAIFGGNALRLLRASGAVGGELGRKASPPRLPERVFDVHGHLGRFKMSLPELSAAETAARLRRYHVERMVVSSVLALSYDVAEGNDEVARAITEQPSLLGYVVLDPHDVEGAAAELARCFRNDRFVGVKLHPRLSGRPTGSEDIRALFDHISPYGKPVLIHNDGPDYARAILEIARAHPTLPIIIAHAGPSRPDVAAFEAAAQADNLYLEFATTFPWRGAVRTAIDIAGKERVLFGSDFPLIDPGYVLGHYQEADLSAEEERAIMWENAVRLFPRAARSPI